MEVGNKLVLHDTARLDHVTPLLLQLPQLLCERHFLIDKLLEVRRRLRKATAHEKLELSRGIVRESPMIGELPIVAREVVREHVLVPHGNVAVNGLSLRVRRHLVRHALNQRRDETVREAGALLRHAPDEAERLQCLQVVIDVSAAGDVRQQIAQEIKEELASDNTRDLERRPLRCAEAVNTTNSKPKRLARKLDDAGALVHFRRSMLRPRGAFAVNLDIPRRPEPAHEHVGHARVALASVQQPLPQVRRELLRAQALGHEQRNVAVTEAVQSIPVHHASLRRRHKRTAQPSVTRRNNVHGVTRYVRECLEQSCRVLAKHIAIVDENKRAPSELVRRRNGADSLCHDGRKALEENGAAVLVLEDLADGRGEEGDAGVLVRKVRDDEEGVLSCARHHLL
eukprot:Opistho-1_new@61573